MTRKLDVFGEALASLGTDIARTAAASDLEAHDSWGKLKTMLKVAQTLGLGNEAMDALYTAGDKVVQKKALWYRRQKRLIKMALELDIDITDMTMKEAEDALTEAREAAKTNEEKQADAMRMLERSMKGAVKASGDKGAVLDVVLGKTRRRATRAH